MFDTVILVRGLISPYRWWGRLLFDHQDAYRLVVSPAVVAEYLEGIRRPALVGKYRGVAARDPHAVLDLIASATVVESVAVPRVSRDPDDDVFLAAAKAGAAYLVTKDADLLDLGASAGTAIVTAAAFLRVPGSGSDRRCQRTDRERIGGPGTNGLALDGSSVQR